MRSAPRLQVLYIAAIVCLLSVLSPSGLLGWATSVNKAIANNLRQLVAAAQYYCEENDVDTVTYNELVGPGKYIYTLDEVDGESYTGFIYRTTDTECTVRTPDGLVVIYYYAGGHSAYNPKTGFTYHISNPVIYNIRGVPIRKRTVIYGLVIVVAVFVVILLIWIVRKKQNDERSG